MPNRILAYERIAALASIPHWQASDHREAVQRSFEFADFSTAIEFVNQVARIAAEMQHYPEWSNHKNRVDITLTTPEVGGLSELDMDMAQAIDELLERMSCRA
jgi:4a-hydroxytetrahydrobiopterin dehydratase